MTVSGACLVLGSVSSFAIVLLHLALALRPHWYRHFGAGELARRHEEGSMFTVLVTLGLAVMFALWGIYALSGAGVIGQLPLLRAVLATIGVVYVLRSLMLPSDILHVLNHRRPLRFVVFSAGSLSAGLLYLIGTFVR